MSHARAFGRLHRLDRSDTCSNDGINLHRSIPLSCALWCHSVGAFQAPGHLFLLRFNIQSRCWKGDTFTDVYWFLVLRTLKISQNWSKSTQICLWSCKQKLNFGCRQGITSSSLVSSRVWTKWCHFAANGQNSMGSSVGKQSHQKLTGNPETCSTIETLQLP